MQIYFLKNGKMTENEYLKEIDKILDRMQEKAKSYYWIIPTSEILEKMKIDF